LCSLVINGLDEILFSKNSLVIIIVVIYETPFEYSPRIKLLYLLAIGLFIGAFIAAYYKEIEGVLFLVCERIFLALLFYFIMPRKLGIQQDKLSFAD
jgi:hypothetical protein